MSVSALVLFGSMFTLLNIVLTLFLSNIVAKAEATTAVFNYRQYLMRVNKGAMVRNYEVKNPNTKTITKLKF